MSEQQQTKALSTIDTAKSFLADPALLAQIRVACSRTMTPERVARIALTAVLSSPKLGQCFMTKPGKASIAKALITASQRGLECDGRQGHLVPFNCKQPDGTSAMTAQFLPGYQGLIDLAYNHPNVGAIWAEAVFEKDEFAYRKGLDRELSHVPYAGEDDPGPLVATYAVCEMRSGSKVFVVLFPRDIKKIIAFSASAAGEDSIWKKHPESMWKKSAIRALCKYIPQSNELRDLLNDEDEIDRSIGGTSLGGSFADMKPANVTPLPQVGDAMTATPPVAATPLPPQPQPPVAVTAPPPVAEPAKRGPGRPRKPVSSDMPTDVTPPAEPETDAAPSDPALPPDSTPAATEPELPAEDFINVTRATDPASNHHKLMLAVEGVDVPVKITDLAGAVTTSSRKATFKDFRDLAIGSGWFGETVKNWPSVPQEIADMLVVRQKALAKKLADAATA
jgi:recombination protein RecT